ncbi:MAG: hypothetical protein IJ400_05875 [Clostridia bacterium]|nr:hypothetical protein [Clostridia bacterium]
MKSLRDEILATRTPRLIFRLEDPYFARVENEMCVNALEILANASLKYTALP